MCKYLAEFIHFIKQKSLFSTQQNFTKLVHKLFSRRENILSSFENILSSLKNIFPKLENNYVTSIEDFYAVIWGSLYRALRELVPCWKASYFGFSNYFRFFSGYMVFHQVASSCNHFANQAMMLSCQRMRLS